jgi:hypothetical protein
MDIKKIKYGCPIVINYISDNDEEITLKSEEKPRPEMEKAFDRLAWQIMQIDGKKCSKDINIAVNELNIKYKKDISKPTVSKDILRSTICSILRPLP